jgi:molybdopterin synthase catalytic subunit
MICITSECLNLQRVLDELQDNSAGAVSIFIGNVRSGSVHGNVLEIYYEVYKEMAEGTMRDIEKEVFAKWNINRIAMIHRIGTLKVGETSVIIGVSSEHREESFQACKYAIDSLKRRVPIWKKEIFTSGENWVDGVSLGQEI